MLNSPDVSRLSNRQLLASAKELARRERHLNLRIIEHLKEIGSRGLHLRHGFGSLFDYAVKELGFGEGSAYQRLQTLKLSDEFPEVKQDLQEGELTLTAAGYLQSLFDRDQRRCRRWIRERRRSGAAGAHEADEVSAAGTPDANGAARVNGEHSRGGGAMQADAAGEALATGPRPTPLSAAVKRELIARARGKSTRQVRELIAEVDPELVRPRDRLRALGRERWELKATVDGECRRGLEQLRHWLAHVNPAMDYGELIQRVVADAVAKYDPVRGPAPRRRRASASAPASHPQGGEPEPTPVSRARGGEPEQPAASHAHGGEPEQPPASHAHGGEPEQPAASHARGVEERPPARHLRGADTPLMRGQQRGRKKVAAPATGEVDDAPAGLAHAARDGGNQVAAAGAGITSTASLPTAPLSGNPVDNVVRTEATVEHRAATAPTSAQKRDDRDRRQHGVTGCRGNTAIAQKRQSLAASGDRGADGKRPGATATRAIPAACGATSGCATRAAVPTGIRRPGAAAARGTCCRSTTSSRSRWAVREMPGTSDYCAPHTTVLGRRVDDDRVVVARAWFGADPWNRLPAARTDAAR